MPIHPFSFIKSSSAVFDPAVLSLTGWWRASYSASPWVGRASAGNSGTHDLSEATNPPSTGTAVNSLVPASFDGTNDILAGTTTSTYLATTQYTHVALVKVSSAIAATGGSPQVDDQIFADQASWVGLRTFDDAGVIKAAGWHWDGAYRTVAGKTISTAWAMVATTFNGATISTDVNNSGSPSTLGVAADVGGLAGTFTLGRSQTGNFPAMSILELMTAQTVLSAGNLASIKSYFNSRYALSL